MAKAAVKSEKVNVSSWFRGPLEEKVRNFIRDYLKHQEGNQAFYPNRMIPDDWEMVFIAYLLDKKSRDSSNLMAEALANLQRR